MRELRQEPRRCRRRRATIVKRGRAIAVPGDVAIENDVVRLFEAVDEELGR